MGIVLLAGVSSFLYHVSVAAFPTLVIYTLGMPLESIPDEESYCSLLIIRYT